VRKVKFDIVSGGEGAFSGAVHRAAAGPDETLELVPEKGTDLFRRRVNKSVPFFSFLRRAPAAV
jgi:hypothetical protein